MHFYSCEALLCETSFCTALRAKTPLKRSNLDAPPVPPCETAASASSPYLRSVVSPRSHTRPAANPPPAFLLDKDEEERPALEDLRRESIVLPGFGAESGVREAEKRLNGANRAAKKGVIDALARSLYATLTALRGIVRADDGVEMEIVPVSACGVCAASFVM